MHKPIYFVVSLCNFIAQANYKIQKQFVYKCKEFTCTKVSDNYFTSKKMSVKLFGNIPIAKYSYFWVKENSL